MGAGFKGLLELPFFLLPAPSSSSPPGTVIVTAGVLSSAVSLAPEDEWRILVTFPSGDVPFVRVIVHGS